MHCVFDYLIYIVINVSYGILRNSAHGVSLSTACLSISENTGCKQMILSSLKKELAMIFFLEQVKERN